jgi:hypothetical protein
MWRIIQVLLSSHQWNSAPLTLIPKWVLPSYMGCRLGSASKAAARATNSAWELIPSHDIFCVPTGAVVSRQLWAQRVSGQQRRGKAKITGITVTNDNVHQGVSCLTCSVEKPCPSGATRSTRSLPCSPCSRKRPSWCPRPRSRIHAHTASVLAPLRSSPGGAPAVVAVVAVDCGAGSGPGPRAPPPPPPQGWTAAAEEAEAARLA